MESFGFDDEGATFFKVVRIRFDHDAFIVAEDNTSCDELQIEPSK